MDRAAFGPEFKWGMAISALQHEGAYNVGGRSASIWDTFLKRKGKIEDLETCGFYYHFREDLKVLKATGAEHFRFSISWSRLFPEDSLAPNLIAEKFYSEIIDTCLDLEIEPWICLYHWDLPQYLEKKGGWTNRKMVNHFADYAEQVHGMFKHKVKNWLLINEALTFTGAGYYLGIHAPGKRGLRNFLPAVHHVLMAQGRAFRRLKTNEPSSYIGFSLAMLPIEVQGISLRKMQAKERIDCFFNKLFIEPVLGKPYPTDKLPFLKNMKKYVKAGDMQEIHCIPDFVGVQSYTRLHIKPAWYIPYVKAKVIPAKKLNKACSYLGWEIYPAAIYKSLKALTEYKEMPDLLVTEMGIPLEDELQGKRVEDLQRISYLSSSLEQVEKAKNEGVQVKGVFFWSLLDNLEWIEGFGPRFGLIHVDFKTKRRSLKASAMWLSKFLNTNKVEQLRSVLAGK